MSEIAALQGAQAQDSETQKYHAFITLAMILAAITGVELVLVYLPFSAMFIFWSLAILSFIKFVCVCAWFMHLIYDRLLLTLLFGAGLGIAAGTVIALLFLLGGDRVDTEAITAF